MVNEIDKAGIPVVIITAMTPIAHVIGCNRIIQGVTINNPCSDIALPPEQQRKLEEKFIQRALKALSTGVSTQTFF